MKRCFKLLREYTELLPGQCKCDNVFLLKGLYHLLFGVKYSQSVLLPQAFSYWTVTGGGLKRMVGILKLVSFFPVLFKHILSFHLLPSLPRGEIPELDQY